MTFVFWYNLLHFLDYCHVVEALGELVEFDFVFEGEFVRVFADFGYHDFRVVRRFGVLFGGEEFFIEFLAVAESGEFNLDVLGSREGNHALGKVDYLDGFAHVEDEDFTAMTHGASFKDKSACLWDEHEVTDDVGVGDLDGATFLDLFAEDWDNGSVGSKDVTEARSDELTTFANGRFRGEWW